MSRFRAALAVVLTACALAACSGDSAGSTPAIDRPAPGPADGAALAATVEQAIGATGTVMVTPDDEYPYPVFVQYARDGVAFVISAEGGPTPTLPAGAVDLVDIRFQSYRDGTYCLAANRAVKVLERPWICARPGATDDFALENAGSLKLELGAIDPYSVARVLRAASDVQVQAPRPGDGATIRYRATLAPKAYLPILTPATGEQARILLRGKVPEDVDLLLTASGLPVRMTVTVPAIRRSVTQTFSEWGVSGEVTTPPDSSVIDSSQLDALLNGGGLTDPTPAPSGSPANAPVSLL